jgi:hydroxymethylbilane synthase
MTAPVRIATRASALARWQATRIAERLGGATTLVPVSTQGDRDRTSAIHAIGGTGVFVKEVQEAVRRGDADVAVHSAKDLPADTPEGLVLAAVPERGDARDALVGGRLEDLPVGATIGTGSVRRRAQLAALRPDLRFAELRGNVGTRVDRAADFDAVVIAAAALDRLGLADRAAELLDLTVMVPMVGQGALAVECRADDTATIDRLGAIDDVDAHAAVTAERSFLRELGGGCTTPCAAYAVVDGSSLVLDALLAREDGRAVARARRTGTDPDTLGRETARVVLDEQGGAELVAGGAA